MAKINQPLSWEKQPNHAYVSISYEGKVIGFCQPNLVDRIIDTLNEDDKLRKALQLACQDLLTRTGSSIFSVEDLIQHYLARVERPKRGTAAIAVLLKERQEELDLTDEEFAKFCDTFRLSRVELRSIYAGEELESNQLSPLCRILGLSIDELIAVWKGTD